MALACDGCGGPVVREGYRHEAALLRRVADLGLCLGCCETGAWGDWTDERRGAMGTNAETWPELPPGEHECDCECEVCRAPDCDACGLPMRRHLALDEIWGPACPPTRTS